MPKSFPLHTRIPRIIPALWPGMAFLAAMPLFGAAMPAFPAALLRWLGLMLAPGAALYLVAERRTPRLSTLTLCALVLSPVVTTVLAIAGLWVHLPVVTIAGAICALAIAAVAIAYVTLRQKLALPDRRSLFWLGGLVLALVFLTAFLPMTHAWWRVRSDAWFHAAVVAQMSDFGIPPQDPYFAGMPLQYMWFYHVLVLVLARGLDVDPFRVMALINIQALVGLGLGAWQLCGVFRQKLAYRLGATAMLLLGFDGAFWVFLPVKLARAMTGDVRGWAEIKRTYSIAPFNYDQARVFMKIYYNQEFFLDKFMVATAFGLALTFMVAGWYGASEFLRTRRAAPLVVFAVALVGMLGFHSLVGFVMLVGVFGGVALAWLTRGHAAFPMRGALVLVGVSALCFLAATPYLYEVMHLKEKSQVFPFGVSFSKTAGIFISCAFALVVAIIRRPLVRDHTVESRFFLLGALAVTAFCLLITLPGPNTYDKLGYLVFLPVSILGGIALADLWLGTSGRSRRAVVAWTVACMLPVNAIAFASCFTTPDEAPMTAPEARISLWLTDNTPRNALIIDDGDRVVFLVTVPRRYLWGTTSYAQQWGYPRLEMSRRLHMRRALYAPGTMDASALEVLGEATEPVYAIVRPEHWRSNAAIVAQPELFQTVYKDDQFRVVRIDTQACRARAAAMADHLSPEELIRESGL